MDANRRKLEAVFLDLDGSLLNSRRQVGERDRRTIARLQQAGVRVYIATGRHYELSARHHRELGLTGPMLASDGAVLYHPVQRRVLYRHPIPPAVSRAAIQAAMDAGEEFYFHDTAAAYCSPNFGRIQVWRDYAAGCGPEDLRPALGQLPPGYLAGEPEVMTFMAHRPSPAFVETLKRLCGETVPLYLSRDGMVAIATAPGWDKGRGAAFLAEQEGFSLENALALGDTGNDLPLLRAAGWPVVPENGSPEAKALARMITADNDHEPLSAAVETLFGDTYSP